MKQGKFEQNRPRRGVGKRAVLPLILVLLILSASVGGTLAYIIAQTGKVENSFTPGSVTCQVAENNGTFTVQNTGNVPAYLRAMVVVNWVKTVNGQTYVYGTKPAASDYTITYDENKWTKVGDIYYYNDVVSPADNADTVQFVTVVATNTAQAPEGYTLTVEVIAEAIQAEGMGASSAQDAWEKAQQPIS